MLLVGRGPGGAEAGFGTHLLRLEGTAFLHRLLAAVGDREEPDPEERDRHREQRRRGVREQRRSFRIAQGGFPHRRRQHRQRNRGDRAQEAADHRARNIA